MVRKCLRVILSFAFLFSFLIFNSLTANATAEISESLSSEDISTVTENQSTVSLAAASFTAGGVADWVNSTGIGGWAWDSSQPNTPIWVHIYITNVNTGELVLFDAVQASQYRSDLASLGYGNDNHGYIYLINWNNFAPGTYSVVAYAIGLDGNNPSLSGCPKNYVSVGVSGSLYVVNSSMIAGWAWRSSEPDEPVTVHIYVRNSSGTVVYFDAITANGYRSDLPGNGNHAFSYPMNWNSLSPGTYTVTAYGIDGNNPSLGTKTFYWQMPLNTVTVKVFEDQSYYSTYSNRISYVNTCMADANNSFVLHWNINLVPSYEVVWNGMPFQSCPLGYFNICSLTSSGCGTSCRNDEYSPNHHKNFDYNFWYAKNNLGYNGYNLGLEVSSASLCHRDNYGQHSVGGYGEAVTLGNFAMTRILTEREYYTSGNVRVIQHEISHCFGCHDYDVCSAKCIMSGGLDYNFQYDLTTIWCPRCESEFDRDAH